MSHIFHLPGLIIVWQQFQSQGGKLVVLILDRFHDKSDLNTGKLEKEDQKLNKLGLFASLKLD